MKIYITLLLFFILPLSFIPASAQDDAVLTYGTAQIGALDSKTSTLIYTFEGAAGDVIYVSAFSPDVYTGMNLYGTNGTLLARVETNAIGSVLGPYELTSSGEYRVEVFRQDWDDSSGRVETTIDFAEVIPIKPDGIYTGTLEDAGDLAFFVYYGTLGQLFGYSAEGNGIAFGINLPSGDIFIDTGIDNLTSEPLNILPEEGEYMAHIQTVNEGGTDYELRLQPVKVIDLEAGASVEGTFSELEPAIFRFESAADVLWSLETLIDNNDGNAWIEIVPEQDPYSVIEADYGSGVNGNPRIATLITPFNGTYYAILRANDYQFGGQDYSYTLSLGESMASFIEAGAPLEGTYSPDTGSVVINYRGSIDERLEVYFQVISDQGQPSIIVLSPDDELAGYFTRSGTEIAFDLILPQSAIYEIVIDNAAYEEIPFEFRLEVNSN